MSMGLSPKGTDKVHCIFPSLGKGIAQPLKLEKRKGSVIIVKVTPGTCLIFSSTYSPARPFPEKWATTLPSPRGLM